jgi:pimeloyl-ACP methyl ester carboxylesterase
VWLIAARYHAWQLAQRQIVSSAFDIQTEDFEEDLPIDQAVIGRQLRYLERGTDSAYLVVLLHGLGLDANDFRPYMYNAAEHTAAITLFGFNTDEAQDTRYRPITLRLHAELVSGAINNLQRRYPRKMLVLAGFSLGADMIFRLTEYWRERPDRRPQIHAMLLLDPNINHSSMVVSGGVSQMNPEQPLPELKRIAQLPNTLAEFHNISEYLHKISTKNLAQIRQHAADFYAYWEPDGSYELFLHRVADLRAICSRIKLLFSAHYEDHFNEIIALARRKAIGVNLFAVRKVDHFDLISTAVLPREIAALTKQRLARP